MLRNKLNKIRSSCTQEQLSEAIRKKAQELFEKNGKKQGRDLDNWLEAERIVKSQVCR